MKTTATKFAFLLFALLITRQLTAQTWKSFFDYDKDLYGFENEDGDRKDLKYKSAKLVDESNPIYTIVAYAKGEEDSKYGIVENKSLTLIFPLKYDLIEVDHGIVHTFLKDKDGYSGVSELFDVSLKKIYTKKLTDRFIQFKNGMASFKNEADKEGVIDSTGKTVIPFEYTFVKMFDDRLFGVEKVFDGKMSIVDIQNKTVIPEKDIYEFENYQKGLFIGRLKSLTDEKKYFAVLDMTGKEIFRVPVGTSENYTNLSFNFYNDETGCTFFDYEGGGNKGLYDAKGNLVIASEYYHVKPFSCNLISVSKGDFNNETVGVYDIKNKKMIVPMVYHSIDYKKDEKSLKAYKDNNYQKFEMFDLTGKSIK